LRNLGSRQALLARQFIEEGRKGVGNRDVALELPVGTKCHLQAGEETVPDTFDLPLRTPLTFRYEIYLNGVLASRAPGCTTTYVLIAMNEEARRVLHPNGKILIAVHCHQTEGGQFIDVGISKRVIMDDSAAPRKR
jgi:hypothetical protein